jgi:hypothetical protein
VARIIVGMTVNEILAQLKFLRDEARRKHNAKAGAPPPYVPVWVDFMVKRQG